jgi:hypothetical protein
MKITQRNLSSKKIPLPSAESYSAIVSVIEYGTRMKGHF